jgi:glycosyltransferase involved in cell wall biosynthesis
LRHKKLLVLGGYPYKNNYNGSFVKEQVDCLSNTFEQINVISALSYFPKFMLNSERFRSIVKYVSYPENYSYGNISVYFPKYFPLPTSPDFFMLSRKHLNFHAIHGLITREKIGFDIVHSHFIFPAGYVGMKLKERYHVPFIITAHGGDVYKAPFKNDKWFQLSKSILEHADKIITTSIRNFNIITREIGISEQKVYIIGNGFDNNKFYQMNQRQIREKLSLPQDKKILLSVGNLVEIKGHKYLVEAVNKVLAKRKDILCIIIGRGIGKEKLQNQIDSLGLNDFIKVINGVSHDEVPFWMNACDLFVLPSLDEGFPTVIPEALACGKPVIASRVGGIPEIINNKDIGELFQKKNVDGLVTAIINALNKEWDHEKTIKYAQGYTWDNIANKLKYIYKDCLN